MAKSGQTAKAAQAPQAAWGDMQRSLALLNAEAAEATLPAKAEQMVRQWMSRQSIDVPRDQDLKALALAMALAVELESFTPSHSGSTAIDRLLRRRKLDADEQMTHRALATARFTVIRVGQALGGNVFAADDLATGRDLVLYDDELPAEALGVPIAVRIAMLDERTFSMVGMAVPLDEAGLAVAMDFVRPGRGIPHGHRCAAAVYKHVVRHGGPEIKGLNALPDMLGEALGDENPPSPFDLMVADLMASDDWRDPPRSVLDDVRGLTSAEAILECLYKAVATRKVAEMEPGSVYRRFAAVMIEALHLRALAGSGLERAPLDRLSQMIDSEIATKTYPRTAGELFREIRAALSAKPREAGEDLTRVIDRIRALRAKTVDQGCTEQEALAAADKVAELLDRYGLSLGEVELRGQACIGAAIDSTRKRNGPLDDAVPAIAHFCGCRCWRERTPDGTIRSVFFGLPADVEAARYLHDRVAAALDTETAAFRRGELYASLVGGGRQKATASFQWGLTRGIARKLDVRKADRDAKTFATTGRDLVPVKASVVEDELAKLGMSFTTKASGRGRMVMLDAYEAGQVASGRFEIQSELERE